MKYRNIDFLRTIACIGIVLMHILANTNYNFSTSFGNFVSSNIIGNLGKFVNLFFVISAFSMCCGYYERIKNNEMSLNDFYKKRYIRIFPFFGLLVILDVIQTIAFGGGLSKSLIIEAFSDLTLFFGFFPSPNISVIGVGWTLGVIFAFYILFPFFVFLVWNKKRAWISLIITFLINIVCQTYFVDPIGNYYACNIARCMTYFVTGGVIYLYKDYFSSKLNNKFISLIFIFIGLVFTLLEINTSILYNPISTLLQIIGSSFLLCAVIMIDESKIYSNKFTIFMSSISFEIYLIHMLSFRFVEKVNLLYLTKVDIVNYLFVSIVVFGISIICVLAYKLVEKKLKNFAQKIINKGCN